MMHRVAVTGIGLITAIGATPSEVWEAVRSGRSSIRRVTRFDASAFRSRIAAEVDGFCLGTRERSRTRSRLDRFSQFAVAAAEDAVRDAGLDRQGLQERNAAVYLGSALGGIAYGEEQHERYLTRGIRAVDPGLALSVFAGAGASNVSIALGIHGPSISNANSCASGAIAIGEAFRLVRAGGVDLALAGGVECPLAPLTFGSFASINALSKRNGEPESSCRPFDRSRDGFVMGEGAAVLVLEGWERAVDRGAVIRAELMGYGSTSDAHHMTVPLSDGSEAARSMHLALNDGGVGPEDVDYVSAHATGTILGDAAEAAALRLVFPKEMPPVTATKPLHGHALGASPAIEAAITVMVLEHGFVPGTVNLKHLDPVCEANLVLFPGRIQRTRVALSNAFGFGGINACIVLSRADEKRNRAV